MEECTTEVVDFKSAEAMAAYFALRYSPHKTTLKYLPQYVKEQNDKIKQTELFEKQDPDIKETGDQTQNKK